jgi:hypothetical protein
VEGCLGGSKNTAEFQRAVEYMPNWGLVKVTSWPRALKGSERGPNTRTCDAGGSRGRQRSEGGGSSGVPSGWLAGQLAGQVLADSSPRPSLCRSLQLQLPLLLSVWLQQPPTPLRHPAHLSDV